MTPNRDPRTHVAILDDEPEIRRMLSDALEEAGFRTSAYSRATEFEAALKRTTPDVCLVDLGLPDRDGLALVHRLALESGAAIIIISGRAQVQDRVTGLELGADDYIIKPFRMRELVARIRAVLRRSDPSEVGPRVPLRGGDIVLDEATHTVTVREAPVNLTPTEFNLLRLLMAAPGQVLTRQQLADRLSENGFDGLERTLNVHVRNLRIKVEPDPDNPTHIETVFGVGYRFASRDR